MLSDSKHCDRRLLTTHKAAEWLGLSPRTLQLYRLQGGGPRWLNFGRAVRYDLEDLQAWVRAARDAGDAMSIADAQRTLGIAREGLLDHCVHGRLRFATVAGRVMIRRDDIERLRRSRSA